MWKSLWVLYTYYHSTLIKKFLFIFYFYYFMGMWSSKAYVCAVCKILMLQLFCVICDHCTNSTDNWLLEFKILKWFKKIMSIWPNRACCIQLQSSLFLDLQTGLMKPNVGSVRSIYISHSIKMVCTRSKNGLLLSAVDIHHFVIIFNS